MARLIIRPLQVICVVVIVMIIFDMAKSGTMPPPVPLDEDGNMAPCSDSPTCAAQ